VYAVPGCWSFRIHSRSSSCVVVVAWVERAARCTSSMAPRHWIVAFRKHVFPMLHNPRTDDCGEEFVVTLFPVFREGCGSGVSWRVGSRWRRDSGGNSKRMVVEVRRGFEEGVRGRVLHWCYLSFFCPLLEFGSFPWCFHVLYYPFPIACFTGACFLTIGARRSWLIIPLFILSSAVTTV